MAFILGRKIKMSQIFDEKGSVIPVTLIGAGPCYVTQIKEKQGKDKYSAVQIGFEKIEKKNKIKKTMKGREFRHLKEFRADTEFKKGDKIDASIFSKGDKLSISGTSKGKGFAGVIKRWGFRSKPASHGTKHEERAMGSTGGRFPQRVIKGRKMPGRLGFERVTVENLEVADIDAENNLIAVKGAVPGRPGTLLEIRGKAQKQ